MTNIFEYISINIASFLTLNLLLSTIVILLERRNSTSMLAWLFFLNLFPGIGFFFYILLAQNISKRKIFKYTKEELNLYQHTLSEQQYLIKNNLLAYNDPTIARHKDLILFHNKLSNAIYTQNNQIDIYTTGADKFDQLFHDIAAAKKHIHILYFIIKNDSISKKLFRLLIDKAKAGVEVKLLVDQVGGRKITAKQIRQLTAAGCQFAYFFPSRFKYFNIKGNYRNHRKLVIIDGKIGYTGGFNVGDEYLGLNKKFGPWRDTHLRLIGNAVISLQIRFILDWRNAVHQADESLIKLLPEIPSFTTLYHQEDLLSCTAVQIVDSGPDDINQQIKQGYLQIIHSARKYLYIQTPYFIPDESIIEGLKIAASSGVDVRIMIPNKPDHPFVYWATYSYCGDLLPYGVRAYTYENGFLHAKTIVSDDEVSCVGSCNFDIRSFKLNFELSAFMYNQQQATQLKQIFDDDLAHCREITTATYAKRPLLIKFKESISRLFSPLL